MTKIIAFGDIHGHTHNLLGLMPKIEGSDVAIFLGDGEATLEVLPYSLAKKIFAVRGNCDMFSGLPTELLLEIEGKRILVTHGHLYHVKSGRGAIIKATTEQKADIALFGHTHHSQEFREGSTLFINVPPLGTSRTDEGGSFLEMTIDKGKITHRFCKLEQPF